MVGDVHPGSCPIPVTTGTNIHSKSERFAESVSAFQSEKFAEKVSEMVGHSLKSCSIPVNGGKNIH